MKAPYNCYINGHWIGRRLTDDAEGLRAKLGGRYAPRHVEVKPVRQVQLHQARPVASEVTA